MKRRYHILVVAAVAMIGVLLFRLWPRTLTAEQCGEINQRYLSIPNVHSTFTKDKKINDSVSVDVVLLQAENEAGWGKMMEEFDIADIPDEYLADFNSDSNQVWLKFLNIDSTRQQPPSEMAVIYFYKKSILLLHLANEYQYNTLVRYYLESNIKNNNNQ